MKLKWLTLNKITDAVYSCGLVKTPVSILLAAPPGTGKTWSTYGIADQENVPFIQYLTGAMSPTSHRKTILSLADQTRLIIHDDIGLCSRWDQDQIFGTYMMIIDGKIEVTQYQTLDFGRLRTSVIICCTTGYYSAHLQTMQNNGLFDRLLPIVVGLSEDTRLIYQQSINIFNDSPPKRIPEIIDQLSPQTDVLIDNNVSPRWMRQLSKISQFLIKDELLELIAVINRPMKYEV